MMRDGEGRGEGGWGMGEEGRGKGDGGWGMGGMGWDGMGGVG